MTAKLALSPYPNPAAIQREGGMYGLLLRAERTIYQPVIVIDPVTAIGSVVDLPAIN